MMRAPNTFLPWWTAKQLRDWLVELRARAQHPEIYKHNAPNMAQTRAECRRRRMKGFRK